MTKARSVLLVDDDPDIRFIAEIALSRVGGLHVVLAASADEARAGLCRSAQDLPDAILLDVTMPDMDGPTFLRELQASPDLQHLHVVFLTARTSMEDVQHYLALGARGVVAKPFDPMTLARKLGEILGW